MFAPLQHGYILTLPHTYCRIKRFFSFLRVLQVEHFFGKLLQVLAEMWYIRLASLLCVCLRYQIKSS